MELGLAHSLSRYKLKFSPDKIDTMIVQVSETSLIVGYPKICSVSFFYLLQAVSLLDDLDKELNNYIMRCREW